MDMALLTRYNWAHVAGWFRRLLLMGTLAHAAGARASTPLLPPPDSLSAVLQSNPAGEARVRVLLRVAYAFFDYPDSAGTIGYAQAASRLAHALGSRPLEGQADDMLGFYYQWRRDQKQAAPLLRRAEQLLRGGPADARAANYFHLARLNTDLSHAAVARQYYRWSIRLYQQRHDLGHAAEAYNAFSDNYLLQQQHDSAIYCLVQAGHLAHQLGMFAEEALVQANIAVVLLHQHKLADASRYAHQALRAHYQHPNEEYLINTLVILGHIARAQDSLVLALRYYRRGSRLARKYNQSLSVHYQNIASILDRLGRRDSAILYQRRAVHLTQQLHQVAEQSTVMANLARYYLHRHELGPATRWAQTALATQGNTHVLANTLPLVILKEIAVARQDYREALRLAERIQAVDSVQQVSESQRLAEDLRIGYETERAEQRVHVLEQGQQLAVLRRQRELTGGFALGLAGLALGAGLLRRYRRRQRRREQQLRQSLAADLHDDVGGLLTQISIESALLHTGVVSPDQHQRLARIAESSQQAVRQMGDILWRIDSPHGTWARVVERMRDYAYELLAPAGIDMAFDASDAVAALPLDAETGQQLYLIFKEALHNVVKHSRAGLVHVELRQQAAELVLVVQDDGPGRGSGAGGSGRGLGNMRQRAAAIGGQVGFGRDTGRPGFQVVVRLPVA